MYYGNKSNKGVGETKGLNSLLDYNFIVLRGRNVLERDKKKQTKMKCQQCESELRKVKVKIQDSKSPVISYQCSKCGFFDFEEKSINKAINEIRLKETALMIKQKVIKLSHGRLGMYINKDVARSLNLKGGEEVYVSVPDKGHILISVNA